MNLYFGKRLFIIENAVDFGECLEEELGRDARFCFEEMMQGEIDKEAEELETDLETMKEALALSTAREEAMEVLLKQMDWLLKNEQPIKGFEMEKELAKIRGRDLDELERAVSLCRK